MTKPCPTCGEPAEWNENPDRPFCSERCRLLDLSAWTDERYVVEDNGSDGDGMSTSFLDDVGSEFD